MFVSNGATMNDPTVKKEKELEDLPEDHHDVDD